MVVAWGVDDSSFFSFILTAAEAEVSRWDEAQPPVGVVGSGTVFVVDEELQLRTIDSRMLTQLGFRVVTASSGEEAIAHIRGRDRPSRGGGDFQHHRFLGLERLAPANDSDQSTD